MPAPAPHVAIIGSGIGGLATAMRLAHRGISVTVLERHSAPGGKMRTLPTAAGPVDAGPTVLTMKSVFQALFSDVGESLEDHVSMETEPILARHFWSDGTLLDLMQDPVESAHNVHRAFGAVAAAEFTAFSDRARQLFEAFDGPMMQTASPSLAELTRSIATAPRLISLMDPIRSLDASLRRQFSEPRLAQLFARYATYVGGLPGASPALLSLIWHAEGLGVWHVRGGMHQLARSIAACAEGFGARFHYDTHVTRIETQGGAACAVQTGDDRFVVDAVVFNGDPAALVSGALGRAVTAAVPQKAVTPRSLSASVMSFCADTGGFPLAAHNVFFADGPDQEYVPLAKGRPQNDPTLYVCAQDRFSDATPTGPERFEIILNSPPLPADTAAPAIQSEEERQECQTLILKRLNRFGLTLQPPPGPSALTLPQDFNCLFPDSRGSLYGRSPHGMLAPFHRPTARTAVPGLYLAGGGAHPGPGIPMATLSGKHAAEAILSDLIST